MNHHRIRSIARRRTLSTALMALLSAAALAACGSSQGPAASASAAGTGSGIPVKVQLGFIPNIQNYGVTHGIAEGAFKAAGLDASFTTGGNGINPITLVAAGKADIGIANEESLIAAEGSGLHLVAIGAEFGVSPLGMLCRNDSGVTRLSDIVGKQIGVRPISSVDFGVLLSIHKIKLSSVHIVNISNTDEATLIAGHIACEYADLSLNEPQIVRTAGVPNHMILDADNGLASQENVYFTTEQYYRQHQDDVIKPFMKVLQAQWKQFLANTTAAVNWDMSAGLVAGLDRSQEAFQAKAMVQFIDTSYAKQHGLLALNPALWKLGAQEAYSTKTTSSLVNITPMLDTAAVSPADQ